MKDSPMKNTTYYKTKHSESSDTSALKFKEGGYTSASPFKEPFTLIGLGLTAASMIKGASDKKKATYAAGMSSAGAKASSGAQMGALSKGPTGGFGN